MHAYVYMYIYTYALPENQMATESWGLEDELFFLENFVRGAMSL